MNLLRCQRGTASVEIVVMLPVFILLFLGVLHIHSAGIGQQEAQSAARACAYYYAVNGCTNDAAAHPVCEGLNVGKAAEAGSVKDAKDDTSVLTEVESWPVLGDALKLLFGEGSRARAERQVQSFVGDGDSKAVGRFYLVCNTVSESWSEKISELLCAVAARAKVPVMPGCN